MLYCPDTLLASRSHFMQRCSLTPLSNEQELQLADCSSANWQHSSTRQITSNRVQTWQEQLLVGAIFCKDGAGRVGVIDSLEDVLGVGNIIREGPHLCYALDGKIQGVGSASQLIYMGEPETQ